MLTRDSKRLSTKDIPIKVDLMNHQRAMIYHMLTMEHTNKEMTYAMMSNKVGSGKTYVILTFIYLMSKYFKTNNHQVNLIVVPFNICSQWRVSMNAIFGPPGEMLNYSILTEYSDIMTLYHDTNKLFQYDILLTTSLYFDNIAKTINSLKLKVKRVFFDEADTIKNLLATPLNSDMTWFVSASMASLFPKNTDNITIGNYKLSLSTLQKNDVLCEEEFVNENIVLPKPQVHISTCFNIYVRLLEQINKITQSCTIEQIHAMDYRFIKSGIASEYNACFSLFCHYRERRSQLINLNLILEKDYERFIQRDMKEHANVIKYQIKKNKNEISLCDDIIQTFEGYNIIEEEPNQENKISIICDLLINKIIDQTNEKETQCMCFTNFDYIYLHLKDFLTKKQISFKELDGGNVQNMDAIINEFKEKKFAVLLADSSMYSCGMNLENIKNILFIHRMNDHLRETQIIGRAQRYGRNGTLHLWYVDYISNLNND